MTAQASEIQQVTDDVVFWQAYEPEVKAELCACTVRGSKGWVIIDPIPLTRGALMEMREIVDPTAILLTNGNHARAAAEYRERYEAPVLAHADAVPELEISIDEEISEETVIAGNLRIVTLPGAGAGEVALYSPGKSLHLGDALINMEPLGFTFLPDKYCRDPKEMRRSLSKLTALDFSVVTFAHGLPLVAQAKSRLSQLLS